MVLDTGARNCLSINTETRHTEADFQLLQVQPFQYSVLAIQFDASQKGLGAALLQETDLHNHGGNTLKDVL